MAALQETERALHDSRPPGEEMAAAHTAYLLERVAADDGCALVALDAAGQPVGFLIGFVEAAGGAYKTPAYARVGFISDLYVTEAARGGPVTDALLDAAAAHFRALGIEQLMLAYVEGNEAARRAYEKRGFRPYERLLTKPID